MKMWSGRFRQPLDPEFEKWQRSFPYDQRLLPFELAASRAHANALEHAGVLSSEELSEIVKALGEIAAAPNPSQSFSTIRKPKTFTTSWRSNSPR
jgi:argininosuccinate lyase